MTSDSGHVWRVEAQDSDRRRVDLPVIVALGQVWIIPPSGEPILIPPRSDDALCDAIRQAREATRGGLS